MLILIDENLFGSFERTRNLLCYHKWSITIPSWYICFFQVFNFQIQ